MQAGEERRVVQIPRRDSNDITEDFINLEPDFTAVNHDDGWDSPYCPLPLPL